MKLLIFVGVNVGGYAGWLIGEYWSTTAAIIGSGVGSIVGVYCGWWLARRLLE